jgi:predicted aldo/keto reductase-like oxidoreductase
LSGKSGERRRIWDSCLLMNFTRVAGDYVFRKERTKRFRQWIYHKFCFFKEKYGTYGCVGCGRCIKTCLKHIDVTEVIKEAVRVK